MNEKKRLEQAIQTFFERRETLQKELQELRLDTKYAPEYRQQLLFEKETAIGKQAERAADEAKAIILSVQAKLRQALRATEKEAGTSAFQAKLSSILHSLELGAGTLSDEQILKAVTPFRDNPYAVAALRGAISKGGIGSVRLTAIWERVKDSETVIHELDALLHHINSSLTMHPVYSMNLETASIMMLLSKWDDNLMPCNDQR